MRSDIEVKIAEAGVHYFKVTATGVKSGESTTQTFYFYVNEMRNDFPWYPDVEGEASKLPTLSCVYREGQESTNIIGLSKNDTLDVSTSSQEKTFQFNLPSSSPEVNNPKAYDSMVCIGLQYSDINDTSRPIIKFNSSAENDSGPLGSLVIYQDHIESTQYDYSG